MNINFNEDRSFFTCCTLKTVRVFRVEPFRQVTRYDYSEVGIVKFCEMLSVSNILAMVPNEPTKPNKSDKHVLLYDDVAKTFIWAAEFKSSVKAVRFSSNKLFIVLENEIDVFDFPNLNYISKIETPSNKKGLFEVFNKDAKEKHMLFYPGVKSGSIHFTNVSFNSSRQKMLYKPSIIHAHENDLAHIVVNRDGSLLATTSKKGTLIRVWDTTRLSLFSELRRGSDSATIYCINFSENSDFLCVSSNKGTIHIFALANPELNRRSKFSAFKILVNYADSQWDFTSFVVPSECSCLCAFGSNNSIYVACVDGSIYKYIYDKNGKCSRESYQKFVDFGTEEELDSDSDNNFS